MFDKRKAVIFDLDGTLLDTLTDLMHAINNALRMHGYPERTRSEVRMFVGNGIDKLAERAIPGGRTNPDYEAVAADTKRQYALHCEDCTAPYPGIPELLTVLRDKGLAVAVVSNKPDAQVRELCNAHFGDLIQASAGASEQVRLKPAPDTLLHTVSQLGLTPDEAVYCGDSDVDIMTAANAGMPCISVLWGFRDRPDLERAGGSIFVQTPSQIADMF